MIERPPPLLRPPLNLTEAEAHTKEAIKATAPYYENRRDWEMRIMQILYESSREVQMERKEIIK